MRLEEIVAADLASSVSDELGFSALHRSLSDASSDDVADHLLENFVKINLDDMATSTIDTHQVVKITSDDVGASTKLGNLIINWKKILRETPSFALTGASSIADPQLFILASAVLVTQLSNHAHVDLTRDHISIIRFIIANGSGSPLSVKKSAISCDLEGPADDPEYQAKAINRLSELGIISVSDNNVTLRERVILRS